MRGGPQHAQRQAGAVGGDRRQHRVQAHADVGEPPVDVRARVVEPAPRGDGEPLRQPADSRVVGEPHGGALQAPSAVDPDACRAADEDVGGAWIAQQLVERTRAGELLAQGAQCREDIEVGRHPARFGAHRGGDRGRVGVAARRREPGAHPLDQADRRGAHDALRPLDPGDAGQLREHRARRARERATRPPRRAPGLDRAGQPRLGSHRDEQGHVERTGDLFGGDAARGRPAHGQPQCAAVLGQLRRHPGRGGARADVGGHDQQRQVDAAERRDRRLRGVAGYVAHDGFARPPPGFEHRRDRRRCGPVRGPVAREQRQLARRAAGDRGRGQRRVPRRGGNVAAADVDRGPAQAFDLLGAEHQVEPAAERVAVDQQRSVAAAHGRDRECGGEHRGPCAAAPAHDRDGRAAATSRRERLRRLGEHPDQPGLAIRQGHDVRGADRHRVPPDRAVAARPAPPPVRCRAAAGLPGRSGGPHPHRARPRERRPSPGAPGADPAPAASRSPPPRPAGARRRGDRARTSSRARARPVRDAPGAGLRTLPGPGPHRRHPWSGRAQPAHEVTAGARASPPRRNARRPAAGPGAGPDRRWAHGGVGRPSAAGRAAVRGKAGCRAVPACAHGGVGRPPSAAGCGRPRQGRVPGRVAGRVRSRVLGRVVGRGGARCSTPCRPARRRSHRGLPVAIWLALDGATPFRLATSSAQRERIMGAVDKPQRWGQLAPRNAVAAIPVGALWKCENQGTPTRARAGNGGVIGGSGAGRGTTPARGDWRGPSAVQLRGVELNPCPDASGRRQL